MEEGLGRHLEIGLLNEVKEAIKEQFQEEGCVGGRCTCTLPGEKIEPDSKRQRVQQPTSHLVLLKRFSLRFGEKCDSI